MKLGPFEGDMVEFRVLYSSVTCHRWPRARAFFMELVKEARALILIGDKRNSEVNLTAGVRLRTCAESTSGGVDR